MRKTTIILDTTMFQIAIGILWLLEGYSLSCIDDRFDRIFVLWAAIYSLTHPIQIHSIQKDLKINCDALPPKVWCTSGMLLGINIMDGLVSGILFLCHSLYFCVLFVLAKIVLCWYACQQLYNIYIVTK